MIFKRGYEDLIFSLSARNSAILNFYHSHIYKPQKGTLACFYNKLSTNLVPIYVIQVGANDGITHDPIHKYIKRDQWLGLLIEPQERVYRNRLFPLYRRNPLIHIENIAVNDHNGIMDFYRISFCDMRWATGLSTFHLPTLQKKVDAGEIDKLAARYKVKTPPNISQYLESVPVECKTFDFLRQKFNIKEVDVLQIDTEGFDFEIVKLYDLENHKPKVIVFESSHLDEAAYAEAASYFEQNGYIFRRIKGDSLAVLKSFHLGLQILEDCF